MVRAIRCGKADPGVVMRQEDIERFIEKRRAKGDMVATRGRYEYGLNRLNSVLTADKCMYQDTLAKRQGIETGPVFITRKGTPIDRTNVTTSILQLSEFSQVPKDRATPRCPRKLYQTTKSGIEASVALLVEQAMERQLEEEQLSVGWEG